MIYREFCETEKEKMTGMVMVYHEFSETEKAKWSIMSFLKLKKKMTSM